MKTLLYGCLLLLLSVSCRAQSIYLDDTWGDTGVVLTTGLTSTTTAVYSLLVLPDGGILAAGVIDDTAMVIKYLEDGTIDNSFGVNGIFRTERRGYFKRVVRQPDGQIVAAGTVLDALTYDSGMVVRLMPGGTRDMSFATSGEFHFSFAGSTTAVDGVSLRTDGKILVNGAHIETFPGLLRLKANGTPDSAFCDSGILVLSDPARIMDCMTLPDGRIACGGRYGTVELMGMRLTSSGAPDTLYNHTGKAYCLPGTEAAIITCAVVQPDGKIIAGGLCHYGAQLDNFVVARFDTSGRLDATFGDTGVVNIDFDGGYDDAYGLALTGGGDILVTGYAYSDSALSMGTAKLYANGQLATMFGAGGKVVTDISSGVDMAWCVTMQPDGKVIIGGRSWDDAGMIQKLTTVRYKTEPNSVAGTGQKTQVELFPNPADKDVHVRSSRYPITLQLYDMLGHCLQTASLSGDGAIDCANLAPGVYLVDIKGADDATTRRMLQVVR